MPTIEPVFNVYAPTTYGQIKQLILSYMQVNDPDLINALPFIVGRVNRRLRLLQVPEKERRVHVALPFEFAAAVFEEIKDAWVQTQRNPATSLYDADYPEQVLGTLRRLSVHEMVLMKASDPGATGIPAYFSYVRKSTADGASSTFEFMVHPAPTVQSIEIVYWERPTELVNDADTNTYTNSFPDLMVYGGVAEAHRFMRSEEKMLVWEAMFKELYDEIERGGHRKAFGGSTQVTVAGYA